MAIQSGCVLGLDVVATTSCPESTEWCGALGASAVIDHRAPLADGLRAAGHHLVDRVPICADLDHYWPQLAGPTRRQGAICSIVANRMPIDLKAVMDKYSRFCWEAMFARSNFDTPDLIEQHRLLGRIASWIDAGQIRRTVTGRLAPINAANVRAFTGSEHPSDHADHVRRQAPIPVQVGQRVASYSAQTEMFLRMHKSAIRSGSDRRCRD